MKPFVLNEDEYPHYLVEGEKSLVAKFGPCYPYTGAAPEEPHSREFERHQLANGEERLVPVASDEIVKHLEKCILSMCEPYCHHIMEMDKNEIEAYQWIHYMAYDMSRGLGMGQVPHVIFRHSQEFEQWEREQERQLDMREKALGMI